MAQEAQIAHGSGTKGGVPGGLGLFSLIGMVVSSCIGSGAFALTGQLGGVAAPGPALIAWLIVGVGFLCLALSLKNLAEVRPDLDGIFNYATQGFGPFAGFISGWGYWLSAWLGNVAFATIMMSAVGFFYEPFLPGNTVACIAIASVVMWGITILVIRGVESASFINAIVMVAKVAALALFVIFALVSFNAGVFTADFWGTLYDNAVAMGQMGANAVSLGSVSDQIVNCMMIMFWCFIGIEGASVVSSRAKSKAEAGQATVIGLIALLVIYIGVSVLPFGVLPFNEIAAMDYPAMTYVMDHMAPGWGGAFITIAMIVSVAGSWLSFTILPAETTQLMADHKLIPAKWGELNSKGAPQFSLIIVGLCTQIFMLTLIFTEDAYNFAYSMCTVAIVITWALASAYNMKVSFGAGKTGQGICGLIATVFLILGVILNGMSFLLLTCVGYIPGVFVYIAGRKEAGEKPFTGAEMGIMGVIVAAGIAALVMVATGIITF
ncbi:basic amino acid/polyamine antiporter [Leptogranulimonas caecicola]|uniref:Arginine-ornithine antiporter n=2 Tax=Coriobacteriales TaxID=84999 RepID=A0AAU9D471_9ACTN|nr:basic amino acid/polyamine antiporter [Leptogranulimonas caecicola]BCV18849.1 arginine-ornithine antiporter [Atopobiaceae bacterium P1]BDC91179.1 arginine-ornithine antiporter [Leptogranulimonas caecicola]